MYNNPTMRPLFHSCLYSAMEKRGRGTGHLSDYADAPVSMAVVGEPQIGHTRCRVLIVRHCNKSPQFPGES